MKVGPAGEPLYGALPPIRSLRGLGRVRVTQRLQKTRLVARKKKGLLGNGLCWRRRPSAHLQRDVVDVNKLHGGPHAPVHLQRRPEAAPHPGGEGGRVSALERETQAVSGLRGPRPRRRHQDLGVPNPEHGGVLKLDPVPFVCRQHTCASLAVQLQGRAELRIRLENHQSGERCSHSVTADLTGDSCGSLALGIKTTYGSAISSFQNNLQS